MDTNAQRAKAEQFRQMHHGSCMLILPNAWDVASAKLFEHAGFSAIATTSGGVAWTLGYPDGQRISRAEMLQAVGRIARAVSVPVSADLEAGYGTTVEDVVETMRMAIEAGVVGVNFEDGTGHADQPLEDVARQVEKIAAIRAMANDTNVPLVINARIDTYLRRVADAASRFEQTLERARAYRQAGADCIFVIGLRERETIARLVQAIEAPLNILAGPGTPSIPELEQMGVRRVSFGSGIAAAALSAAQQVATEIRDAGTYTALAQSAINHHLINQLLTSR